MTLAWYKRRRFLKNNVSLHCGKLFSCCPLFSPLNLNSIIYFNIYFIYDEVALLPWEGEWSSKELAWVELLRMRLTFGSIRLLNFLCLYIWPYEVLCVCALSELEIFVLRFPAQLCHCILGLMVTIWYYLFHLFLWQCIVTYRFVLMAAWYETVCWEISLMLLGSS